MPTPVHLQDDQQERLWKSVVLTIAAATLFIVLMLRLFHLQVVQADTNKRLSAENSMQLRVLKAPRGRIFDRNGVALARNRPSYTICVLPYKLKDRDSVIERLCTIRDSSGAAVFDSTELAAKLGKAIYRRFDPTPIKEDASIELVSIIEEHARELPGVIVETESRREYPLGKSVFHILGYMGGIPEKDFDELKTRGYLYGDHIGKAGLEKQYEEELRGTDGQEYVEVNAYGKRMGQIEEMPRIDPAPGLDAYLSVDSRLQMVADSAFPDTLKGSVVAIDPRNGEVRLMFSSPGLDPNIFSLATELRNKFWAQVATDPSLPLNNRATSGTYPPGSTFKLVSAVASMDAGGKKIHSRMPTGCTGGYRIGTRFAKCWYYPRGHGRLSLEDAVKYSCNVYFFQVGLNLGDEVINHYARKYGLGEPTGIDLPQEKGGWLSGEKLYNERFKKRGWKWTRGLVLDLAIGQSQLATPLQLAVMSGGLADGEKRYRTFLVKEFRTRQGVVVRQTMPRVEARIELDNVVTESIQQAMNSVVGPGGTGWRSQVPGIPVGGKTGSAENPHGEKTHALFVAAAPVDNPVIAIAVVVENAGHGGSIAAPISGAVLRHFFANDSEGIRIVEARAEQKKKDEKS